MSEIKKQLKFPSSEQAEQYFDCPMSEQDYIQLLIENDILPPNNE